MTKLPNDERETHINMNSLGDKMQIYTTERYIMRRLDKYVEESDNWKVVDIGKLHGEVVSKTYEAPRDLLLIRKQKRVMTEEQRLKAAERLRNLRAKKNIDYEANPATSSENDEEIDFSAEYEVDAENDEKNNTETASSVEAANASSDEEPRPEPEKLFPEYEQNNSVIDEMENMH